MIKLIMKDMNTQVNMNWKKTAFVVILFTGIFILLYASSFDNLFLVWANEEDYSHGFLVIPVSLYLIWMKRRELFTKKLQPSYWGYLVLLIWAALYFMGVAGTISTFVYYSMIVFLLGVVITLAGFGIAKTVFFPIFFLVFMLPIPSEIYTMLTNPMKLFATTASVGVLHLMNVPVYQEGNIMQLPNYSMQVVVACSGIRSLISVIALALLMGYVLFESNLRRLLILFIALPISLMGNILRISITGILAYYISPDMAEGYSHTMAGLVTFIISFIILLIGVYLIQWIIPEKE